MNILYMLSDGLVCDGKRFLVFVDVEVIKIGVLLLNEMNRLVVGLV